MRALRITSSFLAGLFLLAIFLLEVSGNDHLFKAVASTYLKGQTGPSIDEYKIFPYREVEASEEIPIHYHAQYNALEADVELMASIEKYEPIGLLILKDGDILFEKYWEGYSEESRTNSFSVAKSIVGLSIGKCIELGLIKGLDQKVIDFIPELKGEYRSDLSIRNLMTMTSGMDFDESYGDPFGFMAKAYYGDELLKKTLSYHAAVKPGSEWKYLGGNSLLLSIIVERVSGQSLSDFVSVHFWKPLGASGPALWSLDEKGGLEKAYCCFYTNTHDFSRIGQLVLDSGRYVGKQVLNPNFVQALKEPVRLNDGEVIPYYGMQWWRVQHRSDDIVYARGILGQYIIVIPELNAVVVRLGRKRGEKDEHNQPSDIYHYIDLAYDLCEQL